MENDEDFNRILEMNIEAERRRIASMALQGLLANPEWIMQKTKYALKSAGKDFEKGAIILKTQIAEDAIEFADALIAELNKKRDGSAE